MKIRRKKIAPSFGVFQKLEAEPDAPKMLVYCGRFETIADARKFLAEESTAGEFIVAKPVEFVEVVEESSLFTLDEAVGDETPDDAEETKPRGSKTESV